MRIITLLMILFLVNNIYAFSDINLFFTKAYGPVVTTIANKQLVIKIDEENSNYFGGMNVENNELVITIGSKAHLESGVTKDSYLALLCHEVGHLLGGPPYKKSSAATVFASSVEGQCDYYAASECLPRLFAIRQVLSDKAIDELPMDWKQLCLTSLRPYKQCLQILSAGQNLINSIHLIYLKYPNAPVKPTIQTPEQPYYSFEQEYPSLQCRLDTFIHGAKGWSRPLCWFKTE